MLPSAAQINAAINADGAGVASDDDVFVLPLCGCCFCCCRCFLLWLSARSALPLMVLLIFALMAGWQAPQRCASLHQPLGPSVGQFPHVYTAVRIMSMNEAIISCKHAHLFSDLLRLQITTNKPCDLMRRATVQTTDKCNNTNTHKRTLRHTYILSWLSHPC